MEYKIKIPKSIPAFRADVMLRPNYAAIMEKIAQSDGGLTLVQYMNELNGFFKILVNDEKDPKRWREDEKEHLWRTLNNSGGFMRDQSTFSGGLMGKILCFKYFYDAISGLEQIWYINDKEFVDEMVVKGALLKERHHNYPQIINEHRYMITFVDKLRISSFGLDFVYPEAWSSECRTIDVVNSAISCNFPFNSILSILLKNQPEAVVGDSLTKLCYILNDKETLRKLMASVSHGITGELQGHKYVHNNSDWKYTCVHEPGYSEHVFKMPFLEISIRLKIFDPLKNKL